MQDNRHELKIILRLPERNDANPFSVHPITYTLENKVQLSKPPVVTVTQCSGKVDIKLFKDNQSSSEANYMWKTLGNERELDDLMPFGEFRTWILVKKIQVTHDVEQYELQPKSQVNTI